ncbi:MAG: UDP-N-acetylmuramoyl-tripeptide--D-alanyl-D-alanine ligase [Brevefilum sp.]
MINLKDIVSALTGHTFTLLDQPISSAVIDSRQAAKGSLFIALPGEQVDGHDYVQPAFDNGAILALVDKDLNTAMHVLDLRQGYFQPALVRDIELPLCLRVEDALLALHAIATQWRQAHPVRTIGITGSVGKTTTKELISALLSKKASVLKNPGNRNNEIGLPLTLLELEPQHQYAVLEMGFYVPGEIQTLCEIARPQVGVITNIGMVHAERAGSQAIIAKGKAELVESLPPAPEGVAILNMDDPWVRKMAEKTEARVLSYGITEQSDLMARDIQTRGLEGISCILSTKGENHLVHSPLLGAFSAYTILCAAAVALTEGLDWPAITAGLAESRVDLRMRPLHLPNDITVLDDTYNASPTSTIAALALLRELSGRRVAVLGDMLELGQYEHIGHQNVGVAAVSAADALILIGERSKIIAESALNEGFPPEHIQWFPNSIQAAFEIWNFVQQGDVILVKGSNSMRMDHVLAALQEARDGK